MSTTRELLDGLVDAEAVEEVTWGTDCAPVPLIAPRMEEGLAEVLRYAARDGLRVLPVGGASKLGWRPRPERVDLLLSTRALAGIVAYEAADGTLTARAGTRIMELERTAAAGGHHLTPLVSRPAETTLGGAIGAGQSGLDRLRHGPLRHHLLGTRVLLADGNITKSGGRLVKNVTGYDLSRLWCGSHGSLAVILEASLRLFTAPECVEVLRTACADEAAGLAAARAVLGSKANPLAVVVENESRKSGWILSVVLCGREEVVAYERGLLPAADEVLAGEEARRALPALRDLEADAREGVCLRLESTRSALETELRALAGALTARGLEHRAVLHPGVVTAELRLVGADAAALAKLPAALEECAQLRVRLRGFQHARALDAEPWRRPPVGAALMRRLRAGLDPEERFCADRALG